MADNGTRYLEEYATGQRFVGTTRFRIDTERAKSFAAEFDPQPFHLDDDAAKQTFFQGLAASGWHTAAATMRLLVDSDLRPIDGIVGAGIDELRWARPVRPGDELRVESEVIEVAPLSNRQRGTIRVRTTTLNQKNEVVQTLVATLVVSARPQK